MPPPRNPPLESFGPELRTVLIEGSRRELRLPFPDVASARFFQVRCNSYRTALRDRNHPDYPLTVKARVSVLHDKRLERMAGDGIPKPPAALVIVKPQDSDFRDILQNAGLTLDTSLDTSAELSTEEPLSDDFLESLYNPKRD